MGTDGTTSVGSVVEKLAPAAATLAFALPQPWGIITAAGIDLFTLLFGPDEEADPFTDMTDELESFMQQQSIEQWARTVHSFVGGSNGLQAQQSVLKATSGSDQAEYIKTTLLPMLNRATDEGVGGNVYGALVALQDETSRMCSKVIAEGRDVYYRSRPHPPIDTTLDLALTAATVFLLGLKLKIQLYAQLAALARNNGDDAEFARQTGAWLEAYAQFEVNIDDATNGLKVALESLTDRAKEARLSLVGEIFLRTTTVTIPPLGPSGRSTTTHLYGWGFVDAATENPDMENSRSTDEPKHYVDRGPLKTPPVTPPVELADARTKYVSKLASVYESRKETVTKWETSLQSWSSHIPPTAPKSAPTIPEGAKWMATSPQGKNWVEGNQVSYALAFANDSGPGPIGPWGEWAPIEESAFPTVTVPTDQLQIASARWIYRRFESDPTSSVAIVSIITDNTTESFVDQRQ